MADAVPVFTTLKKFTIEHCNGAVSSVAVALQHSSRLQELRISLNATAELNAFLATVTHGWTHGFYLTVLTISLCNDDTLQILENAARELGVKAVCATLSVQGSKQELLPAWNSVKEALAMWNPDNIMIRFR